MAASLSEVARLSGVSIATASRVLNPDSTYPIKGSTRERVLAAAAQLDYRSNGLARGLKAKFSRTVGVIVHDIRDPYFSECARAIGDTAETHGFLPVVCSTDRDADKELRFVEMLREQRAAGVIFVGGGFVGSEYVESMRRHISAIQEYGGRVIALGPRADALPAEVPDNFTGARDATAYLIGLGHTRIALIDGPAGLMTCIERHEGYRVALAEHGIPYRRSLVVPGDFTEDGGCEAAARVLRMKDRPTAIFALNDLMAVGVVHEVRRHSLRVPDDVSVMGFDDLSFVRLIEPPLTTVSASMAQIGRAGMERLVELLGVGADELEHQDEHRHPARVVPRASTAPPAHLSRPGTPEVSTDGGTQPGQTG
jgi:LacI family transcriptional regulator